MHHNLALAVTANAAECNRPVPVYVTGIHLKLGKCNMQFVKLCVAHISDSCRESIIFTRNATKKAKVATSLFCHNLHGLLFSKHHI